MKERVYDKRPYRARDWKRTGNERIWKEKKNILLSSLSDLSPKDEFEFVARR